MTRFIFPEWTETLKKWLALLALGAPIYILAMAVYGVSPEAMRIGHMPEQPVPYSHALHVGELGLDCRYCHNTVDRSGFAAIPPAATCMNCHTLLHKDNPRLLPVRESYATGRAVDWVKVHDLPDYVFFNHSAHVTRGVGCESCHGRIDQMGEVYQASSLTMGWCLSCHRDPDPHLRDPSLVTVMGFQPPGGDPRAYGAKLRKERNINPNVNCSTCHR